ncbi:MAG TPA: acyl-CoA dehydrogenase [Jatrophihabitans sp.]|jgi:alkylation response protein AidB-like acyl-CoA dehydrogenase
MRFAVAEDAAALRSAVDAVLAVRGTPATIRAGWGGDWATVRAAWGELAATGLAGALVGEAAGGIGLDESALVPALERVGISALPVPVVETVAVTAPLLEAAAHPLLADVLAGRALVAAQLTGGPLVPFGAVADFVLLADADGALRLHERGELAADPVRTVDASRGLLRLRERPTGGVELAPDGPAASRAWQRGVLGVSALLVGLADQMLGLTVGYVTKREQFGVPVGSFQAVKHHLADVLLAVEFARPAVLAAGWAQATDAPEAARATSLAKVLATDAATLAARTCIQCHGAIGYTTEYDLHLYAKRAWALARSWGSADLHRARLAAELGLTDTTGRQ